MKKQVFGYLHTHWDREWYRDKEDFNIRLLDVMDIVLDELKHDRAPFFYLDGQVIALLDYLKYRENKKDEIINLIKKGRLAIGPYFVSSDSYLVNINSMLKNLDLGLEYSKEFSQKKFIGYLSDIFGVSKSAFDALKLKNIDKAIIWRGVNPKKINNNCNFIKNDIKTLWLAQGYFNDFLHGDLSPEKKAQNIKIYLDKIAQYSKEPILLPIGGDHLGILKNAVETIGEINKHLDDYKIILTSPFEYFKNAEFKYVTKEQEFLDNAVTYILQGVYSTRIPQKVKNSFVQNKLARIVEPFNFYSGKKYDKNIDFIYETLIKNHAHDGIYGCSTDSVAHCVDARFEKCENAILALEKKLTGDFKKKYNIKGKSQDTLGLINLSNNDNIKKIKITLPYILKNSQVIEKTRGFSDELLYDSYKIPVTEDICDLYTQVALINSNKKFQFNFVKIKKPSKMTKITRNSIENKYVSLFCKNKKIYVLNKKTNIKFELKLTDIKDRGDSYNFAPRGKRKEIELKDSKIIYSGLIQSSLKLIFKDIELDITLDNHSKFLHFCSKINNKKLNHKIQLTLIGKNDIKKTISSCAIGLTERNIDPCYKIEDYMPPKDKSELKQTLIRCKIL